MDRLLKIAALAAGLCLLAGCAGTIDRCDDGLIPPPPGSAIPEPHAGADTPNP